MDEKKELVSIVVPVYNCENYIERCIKSLLEQTYKNIEIILINDGSKDRSLDICKKYSNIDKRIVIIDKKNEGVSKARNTGIKKSNGKFISFVDADDYIDNTFIEEMLKKLYEYDADYVTCGYKRIYNEDHIEYVNNNLEEQVIDANEYITKLLNVQNGYGFAHMKLIKKEKIQNIEFNPNIQVGEDALFNIMLCENLEKIAIYNKSLYNYFFNQNSVVRKFDDKYSEKYLKSMEEMCKYIKNKYSDNYIVNENLQNYIAYHVLLVCVNYCYHPENDKGGRKLLKSVCNNSIFREAIKKSNYKNLSITRKISLFTLKHKMYYAMELICKYRQRQFKK